MNACAVLTVAMEILLRNFWPHNIIFMTIYSFNHEIVLLNFHLYAALWKRCAEQRIVHSSMACCVHVFIYNAAEQIFTDVNASLTRHK